MNTQPTPDEARAVLRDIDHRRTQTAERAGWPRWAWVASGAVVAAFGLLADRQPGFFRDWGSVLVVLLLVAALASNSRRGGALLRRQARPRVTPGPAALLWSALVVVLFVGGGTLAVAADVPHAALWMGLAGAVLLAAAGPWWQRRVLAREAGR